MPTILTAILIVIGLFVGIVGFVVIGNLLDKWNEKHQIADRAVGILFIVIGVALLAAGLEGDSVLLCVIGILIIIWGLPMLFGSHNA